MGRHAAVTEEAEQSKKTTRWYLCPSCHGKGQVIDASVRRKESRPSQTTDGLHLIGHVPCKRCEQKAMIRVEGDPITVVGERLFPIELCSKCKSWYAIGAGHKQDERNFPRPYGQSHSHWFDLSVRPPGWWEDEGFLNR